MNHNFNRFGICVDCGLSDLTKLYCADQIKINKTHNFIKAKKFGEYHECKKCGMKLRWLSYRFWEITPAANRTCEDQIIRDIIR